MEKRLVLQNVLKEKGLRKNRQWKLLKMKVTLLLSGEKKRNFRTSVKNKRRPKRPLKEGKLKQKLIICRIKLVSGNRRRGRQTVGN